METRGIFVLAALLSVNISPVSASSVNINWESIVPTSLAIPTYLDQVNPSMDRASPIHDAVFSRMDKLGAKMVRYLHWSHSQAYFPELEEGVFNFTLMDPYVIDFMSCKNAETSVMNFDQGPCWLHEHSNCSLALRDPTGTEYGQWISRIVSWYTKGGFTDHRTGKQYTSPHRFKWENYEVLNEPNGNKWLTATPGVPPYVVYTTVYDGIVRVLAADHPELSFTALCLMQGGLVQGGQPDPSCTGDNVTNIWPDAWFEYFFDASNHAPDIKPPEYVTYHFYAIPDAMKKFDPWPQGHATPVGEWPFHLFKQAAQFIRRAEHVNRLISTGSFGGATVKVNVDEVGIIGGDFCPVESLFSEKILYWNVAASLWGYYYGELARLGSAAIAASQITGYPEGTWNGTLMPGGEPLEANYPCVSMMDWRGNGSDTARTWALQMTIDILGNQPKQVFPAKLVPSSQEWPLPSVVYSVGFELVSGQRVILLSNTNSSDTAVEVAGAAGGMLHTVDGSAGVGRVPYRSQQLKTDRVELTASAFAFVEL